MASSLNVIDRIFGVFLGQPIPKSTIQFHHKIYRELTAKAWHVQRIQFEKFDNNEFVQYLKIQREFQKDPKLKRAVEFLEVALEVKDKFLLIEETEMRFRSSVQQKFYDFISKLFSKGFDRKKTSRLLRAALKKIYPRIKTAEGRMVMKEYVLAIESVAKHPLGLELLRTFKKSKLHHYTMLSNVSKTAKTLKKSDLTNVRKLIILIYESRDDFEALGTIIEIPDQHRSPACYAKMLQYIALKHRHAKSAATFSDMIRRLADWEKSFLTLMEIRREYTTRNYRIPREFTTHIPAVEIYRKYQEYLENYYN